LSKSTVYPLLALESWLVIILQASDETIHHMIRYGRLMCAQKLTKWPA